MRKSVFLGMATALFALLMISCNKNHYDFSAIETVEGSGQWKLPIATLNTTIEKVLDKLGEQDLISTDAQGNLQMTYHYDLNNLLVGSQLMNIGSASAPFHFSIGNPITIPVPVAIDTFVVLEQDLQLSAEGARILSASVKEGSLTTFVTTSLVDIQYAIFRSPNILDADGKPLETTLDASNNGQVDMAGKTIAVDELSAGGETNTLHFSWEVHFQIYELSASEIDFDAEVGIQNWKIQRLTGYVDEYNSPFDMTSEFSLPMGKINGQMSLVDARLQILQKNTFELTARLDLDTAELLGNDVAPSMLFNEYPVEVNITPSPVYVTALDKTVTLTVNSKHNAIHMSGDMVFNPGGVENQITVYDTSTVNMAFDAVVPMKFNIPGIFYTDTMNLDLSGVKFPEIVEQLILTLNIDSEMPFNMMAQFYTLDAETGQISDSLLDTQAFIAGRFGDDPVASEIVLDLRRERMSHLFASNKLLMRLGLNTDNNTVILNKEDGLSVKIKADAIYGGAVDINQ